MECPSFEAVSTDKRAYAQANQIQYEEHDPVRGKAILQRHGDRLLVVNPLAMPLTTAELDFRWLSVFTSGTPPQRRDGAAATE